MLSAKELIQYRQAPIVEKTLPEKGTKEYMPQGSWLENKRLQKFHEEREQLLTEPKIQRKCDWVKGEWKPERQLVEVLNDMRHFWRHMGFQEGKQKWLYPEEALFLMETNVMEIWYRGVSLSVQEAFTLLLGNSLSLEKYQVYSHLRRYGYVVIRHQGRLDVTEYEAKLGLDKYLKTKKKKRAQKRKEKEQLLDSETIPSKCAKVDEEIDEKAEGDNGSDKDMLDQTNDSVTDKDKKVKSENNLVKEMLGQTVCTVTEEDKWDKSLTDWGKVPSQDSAGKKVDDADTIDDKEPCVDGNQETGDEMTNSEIKSENNTDVKVGQPLKTTLDRDDTEICSLSSYEGFNKNSLDNAKEATKCTLWNFEELNFPDFGVSCDTVVVTAPSSGDLLGNFEFTSSDIEFKRQSWINKKVEKERGYDEDVLEFSYPEIMHAEFDRTVSYRNWPELKECFQRKRKAQIRERVVPHLYEDGVSPLVEPEKATSTSAVLDQLFVIKEDTQLVRLQDRPDSLPDFDVYLPNPNFKKSNPGIPDHRVCVTRSSESLPDLGIVGRMHQYLEDQVPLHWAVVDSGDIAFIVLSDFMLPQDITIG